jgi:hypothetical protein
LQKTGRPVTAAADLLVRSVAGGRFRPAQCRAHVEDLDAHTWKNALDEVGSWFRLAPDYDETFLAVLLWELQRVRSRGELRAHLLRSDRGTIVGWFIYFRQRGGVSEVVQMVSLPEAAHLVMARLLADADEAGSTAVQGRVEPHLVEPLSRVKAILRFSPPLALVHSRRGDIYDAMFARRTLLTRLDGDWWMPCHCDPFDRPEPSRPPDPLVQFRLTSPSACASRIPSSLAQSLNC